jgi:hypothetical protein
MERAPAPGLIRNPCPADDRIPDPAAVVIRTPIVIGNGRHPHISVGAFIDPAAVIRELVFVVVIIRRKIGPAQSPRIESVTAFVPSMEVIAPGIERIWFRSEFTVGGSDALAVPDEGRAFFAGSFGRAAGDAELGLAVFQDVDSIKAFFQDIKRGVGRVNLKILFLVQARNPQISASGKEMKLGRFSGPAGEVYHIHPRVVVQTQIIAPAELNFDAARICPDFISLDDDKVHLAPFVAQVLSSLNVDVAFNVAQADIASIVVALRTLGKNENGGHKNKSP